MSLITSKYQEMIQNVLATSCYILLKAVLKSFNKSFGNRSLSWDVVDLLNQNMVLSDAAAE